MWFLYLGMESIWCTKYLKYGYILVNEIICEDLMEITQVVYQMLPMSEYKNHIRVD